MESNRNVVKGYFDTVILQGQRDKVSQYRSMDNFRQHSCDGEDNKSGFQLKNRASMLNRASSSRSKRSIRF